MRGITVTVGRRAALRKIVVIRCHDPLGPHVVPHTISYGT